MSEETKTRRQRQPQYLVVGKWDESGETFERSARQPTEPITDLSAMIAWAKATLAEEPGSYEFIRVIPGALTVAHQTELKLTWG